jgi:hypothetical protein
VPPGGAGEPRSSRIESLAEVDRHPRHHFAKVDIRDASAISALLRRYRPQVLVHPEALNICWNDPDLQIPWPIRQTMLSAVDQSAPRFVEIDTARLPPSAPPG